MIFTFRQINLELSSRGDEVGRACGTNGGEEERV
jgi:hypothetical protein